MQKQSTNDKDDWGNPPAPHTPEKRKKAMRAQIILGLVSLLGILLPGFLYWLRFH